MHEWCCVWRKKIIPRKSHSHVRIVFIPGLSSSSVFAFTQVKCVVNEVFTHHGWPRYLHIDFLQLRMFLFLFLWSLLINLVYLFVWLCIVVIQSLGVNSHYWKNQNMGYCIGVVLKRRPSENLFFREPARGLRVFILKLKEETSQRMATTPFGNDACKMHTWTLHYNTCFPFIFASYKGYITVI